MGHAQSMYQKTKIGKTFAEIDSLKESKLITFIS